MHAKLLENNILSHFYPPKNWFIFHECSIHNSSPLNFMIVWPYQYQTIFCITNNLFCVNFSVSISVLSDYCSWISYRYKHWTFNFHRKIVVFLNQFLDVSASLWPGVSKTWSNSNWTFSYISYLIYVYTYQIAA